MAVILDCTVAVGSIVLDSVHLLVSIHARLCRVCQGLVDTVLLHVSVCYWVQPLNQVRVRALAYVRCWWDAVRSCVVVLDQVHAEASLYVLSPCLVTCSGALVMGRIRVEVPVADQNAKESPSPAWVAGKGVVLYWPDP